MYIPSIVSHCNSSESILYCFCPKLESRGTRFFATPRMRVLRSTSLSYTFGNNWYPIFYITYINMSPLYMIYSSPVSRQLVQTR